MRIRSGLLITILSFFATIFMVCVSEAEIKQIKGGWYYWDPYQYTIIDDKHSEKLIGLDVALQRAIAKAAGYKIEFNEVGWKKHLEDLKEGTRDIGAGATKTPAREEFVYFSEPYRQEENSLFIRKGSQIPAKFESVANFLEYVKSSGMRLGVTEGFIYADPVINEFIADPSNSHLITSAPDESESIKRLVAEQIDGFLADRISATTFMWRMEERGIQEVRLNVATPIHLIFSKKSVDPSVVETFNRAIEHVKSSGEYGQIVSDQLFAVLLTQTIQANWFLLIDWMGTVAFAISGLIVAFREKSTLFGAIVFAALPSVGGGIMRDILVNRPRAGVFLSPTYIYIILGTVCAGYFGIRIYHFLFQKKGAEPKISPYAANLLIKVFDALGLAAYTITGVIIAVIAQLEPLWIWGPALATLTGAGGGILRDILSGERNVSVLKNELYAEVALTWGFIYSLFLMWEREGMTGFFFNSIIIVMVGAFVTRMLAVYFNVKSISFVMRHHQLKGN